MNRSAIALELRGLVKHFDRPAVDGLDLSVRAGQFYALLGPNGAGKTTMRQKVALAGALVHEPRLLILDEPLTGLDAGAARQVKDVLTERVRGGATVIMTTHILEVAERMAERIGIIDKGRLIAEGTLDDLRHQAGRAGSTLEDVFLDLVAKQSSAA